MKEHRVFVCDGEKDDVEVQQAVDWVAEDSEHRTATVQTSAKMEKMLEHFSNNQKVKNE